MKSLEQRHRHSVAETLRIATSDLSTQQIFILWPVLQQFTERFCSLIPPLVPAANGEPLVHVAIREAIAAFHASKNDREQHLVYMRTILKVTSDSLSGLMIHGLKKRSVLVWEPVVEPIMDWMIRNQIDTIRTTSASHRLNQTYLEQSILVHLLSTKEIEQYRLLQNRSK